MTGRDERLERRDGEVRGSEVGEAARSADDCRHGSRNPPRAGSGVTVASFTVTDPSGDPGSKWRALVDWGDGQSDKQVVPVQVGNHFEFRGTHTYATAGNFSIKVRIAVPGSGKPDDNVVTTSVSVNAPTPTPTPTPTRHSVE